MDDTNIFEETLESAADSRDANLIGAYEGLMGGQISVDGFQRRERENMPDYRPAMRILAEDRIERSASGLVLHRIIQKLFA